MDEWWGKTMADYSDPDREYPIHMGPEDFSVPIPFVLGSGDSKVHLALNPDGTVEWFALWGHPSKYEKYK